MMRRHRVVRTASASSLCIFCACRLRAIDLPAATPPYLSSSPLPSPFHSSSPLSTASQRRPISTTKPPFQFASPTSAFDNGSDSASSPPPWYDPTSSLSLSEQREKARRVAIRQQYEAEKNAARLESERKKEEDERNREKSERLARREAIKEPEREAGRATKAAGMSSVEVEGPQSPSVPLSTTGLTLSQAMGGERPQLPRNVPSRLIPRNPVGRNGGSGETFRLLKVPGDPAALPQTNSSKVKRAEYTRPPTQRASGETFRLLKFPSNPGPLPQTKSRNVEQAKNTKPPTQRAAGTRRDIVGSKTPSKVPQKVSNPFGAPATTPTPAAKATAPTPGWGAGSTRTAPMPGWGAGRTGTAPMPGWGAGSTRTAPLQYGQAPKLTVAKSVAKPGEDSGPNVNDPIKEVSKSHLPGDEVERLKYSSGQGSGLARNTRLQEGESERQAAEQVQPASTETGTSEAFDYDGFLGQAGYSESSRAEPSLAPSIPHDPTPSSETAAPEAYDHSAEDAQPLTEPPAISHRSEPLARSAGRTSSGRSEDDGEPVPKQQRQEPPQTEQRLKNLEQQKALGVSSFGSFESDAEVVPETRQDDPPAAKPANSLPLAQVAQQTKQTQGKKADIEATYEKTSSSVSAPSARPAAPLARPILAPPAPPSTVSSPTGLPPIGSPPTVAPPTVLPPPASAISAGGQLAWQPIAGHAQGGQWVWQSLPASPAPQPIAASTASQISTQTDVRRNTDFSQRSSYTPPVRAPEAPSISVSDSGYKATPFKADEYQPESTFDEEKAANWKHLRKRSAEPVQSQSQLPPSSTPAPLQQPHQQTNFQLNYDDNTSVDKAFENHVREREKRLKGQSALEQQREAQQQGLERRDHVQSQDSQPPASRQTEGPRRLYDETAKDYSGYTCARCGEKGHIAPHCVKPFEMPNSGSRSGNTGQGLGFYDRMRKPAEKRESERGQRSRGAWGSDQVFSTEPKPKSSRERRPETIFRFVGPQTLDDDLETQDQSATPYRFEPIGGRVELEGTPDAKHIDSDRLAKDVDSDRRASTQPARRSERFDVDEELDEHAPVLNTRQSREKAARKSRWAEPEEHEVVVGKSKASRRKAQGAGRREYDEDEDDEAEARDKFRARKAARQAEKEAKEEKRRKSARREREVKKAEDATPISIPEFISVQQLSQLLGVRYEQFIDRLEALGYDDVFPGMTLNSEISGMIAMEYNFDPTIDAGVREEEERDLKPRPQLEDQQFLPTRPPVVTIMGHVDHGKTTILDYLRKSSVAAGEAGGITQHIGAFSVPMSNSGKTITFLDTPGHAAFLAMRQRGANVTDIVILVVAADDSVKPQTLEAIKHAKAAGVPMIVAINKIDKEEADVERVKHDLARHGVEIEDFGGETQVVRVSGKTGKGMDELEETVVALSEVLDYRAETDGPVEGWVLEATTKEHGRVATILVRRGTLKPGAVIVAGTTWARVRTLRNEGARVLKEVGPGMPIEVDGWRHQPIAGDEVLQAPTEQKATSVVEFRQERNEREKAAADMDVINEARRAASERQQKEREAAQALKQAQQTANAEGGTADVAIQPDDLGAPQQEQSTGPMDVPFIIKADVSGSAEAVSEYILTVSNPLIAPSVLSSQVGRVHESDVELAHAAGGHIIAFNLPPDPQMQGRAEAKGVKILENNIIYRVLDDVKAVLAEKLPPIVSQRVLGEAEISAAFAISAGGRKKVKIAGCKVRNGTIGKGARVRIMRGSEKIYDGTISSLKNVKKDVSEMRKGSECGMGFDGWEGFEVGDQVQTYEEIRERRKL